jgi:signal peptidase II
VKRVTRSRIDRAPLLCEDAPLRNLLARAALVGGLVFVVDELAKSAARSNLAPCTSLPIASCDAIKLFGPLELVRTANAGSAFGFRQGWWVWIVLAACGVLLIGVYARWLRGAGWPAAIGVGLQVGGALANLFDRLVFGGASDVLYLGGQLTWNLADVALAVGTLVATWMLARSLVTTAWAAR